jgi:hypothetical protein
LGFELSVVLQNTYSEKGHFRTGKEKKGRGELILSGK